jgi:hypothetical protein
LIKPAKSSVSGTRNGNDTKMAPMSKPLFQAGTEHDFADDKSSSLDNKAL